MQRARRGRDSRATTVLVIGATGNFGSRLVGHLAVEAGVNVIPAARRQAPLEALARLHGLDEWLAVDRNALDAELLRAHAVDVVIDASGPFQAQRPNVIEAAIAASAHYMDLADGRAFVTGVRRFDAAARRAGIAVISGASSTPALSHAVLDDLCADWRRIDVVAATICPSNRQHVGYAVVRSILSTVGQSVRVFDRGRWTTSHGWARTRRFHFPGLGLRYASLVDTPDLDLFVERYGPTTSATFEAGLGLPAEHLALAAIGTLVRVGILRSAEPLASVLHALGNRLRRFGVDVGAMEVRAEGIDRTGTPTRAHWRLSASGESGPHVPVLAAVALVRRLSAGTLGFDGATPCTGLLALAEFEGELARLGIVTSVAVNSMLNPMASDDGLDVA